MVKKRCNNVLPLIAILSLLLFFSSTTFGQNIKIRIKAPEAVIVGEQFRADYVIESESNLDEAVIIKNMEDFSIIYGPSVSKSSSMAFKGGKRIATYTTLSTYYLEAIKEGEFNLPRAEINIGGKKYKSDIAKIKVKSLQKEVSNIDAFVRVIASRNRVNLSDTLTLTYRLYTTKEISRLISADFPQINGFYSTNITRSRQSFTEEVIDGKTYKVADLRVLILQPQRTGPINIPEGQITVEYSIPTGRKVRDIWGDVYDEVSKSEKELIIGSVDISVHDLKAI